MMALVPSFAAIVLHEPDPAGGDAVYRSDVNPVGSDDPHVLLDCVLLHCLLFGSVLRSLVSAGMSGMKNLPLEPGQFENEEAAESQSHCAILPTLQIHHYATAL
jgi:hypothetical protein